MNIKKISNRDPSNSSSETSTGTQIINAFSLLKYPSNRSYAEYTAINRPALSSLYSQLVEKLKQLNCKGFLSGGKSVLENTAKLLYNLSTFHDKMEGNYSSPIPDFFIFSKGANNYSKKKISGFVIFFVIFNPKFLTFKN